jgi:hypothetical protein
MKITREGRFERTDIWREGKWLDLWSVVHFLSGVSVGLTFYLLPLGMLSSVIIALLAFTAYEMWEAIVGIEEMPTNRFMDVVVGMASFLPGYFLLAPQLHGNEQFILVFGFVLTANIVMSVFGWLASQKAAELEKRTRARIARQRVRLLQRTEKIRDKFRRK